MTKKKKSAFSIIVNVVLTIFLVFAFITTVYAIIVKSTSEDDVPTIGNKVFISIISNSMHGENGFDKGSLIVCTKLTDSQKENLKKGDVITFWSDLDKDGTKELNTHRIADEPIKDGGNTYYKTIGDNNNGVKDSGKLHFSNIVAIWQSENFEGEKLSGTKFNGMGTFLTFMTSELGFLLIIILPLAVFFIFELVNLIKVIGQLRGKKTITANDEEEIKRKAIEEYLRNQNAEKVAETPTENKE